MARSTGRRHPAQPIADAPVADRAPRELIADDKWLTCVVVDATAKPTRAGEHRVTLELEVTSPRLYVGRSLWFDVTASLDKTIDALKQRFPDVNFLDADDVWNKLGAKEVRAHVMQDPERIDPDTKQVYKPRNRVSSLWPSRK